MQQLPQIIGFFMKHELCPLVPLTHLDSSQVTTCISCLQWLIFNIFSKQTCGFSAFMLTLRFGKPIYYISYNISSIIDINNLLSAYSIMYREESEINTKRANFRESIRRRQIQQIFSHGRHRLQEESIREEIQIIKQQLDTQQKKKQWIYRKSEQLSGYPQKCWFQTIRALSISTKEYSNDYSDWIKSGVIQKMVNLFRQQYKQLNLSQIVACTLYDIFYYLQGDHPQVFLILQYEFYANLVELCVPMDTQAISYFQLINCILYEREHLRDHFIRNGIVQMLATKLKLYPNHETDEVFTALCLCYRIVKIFKHNNATHVPKGNASSIFIPILDTLLISIKRQESLLMILKCFSNLAASEKDYISATLMSSPNLIRALLHFLVFEGNSKLRLVAANTLTGLVGSKNISYAEQLVKQGLLDSIAKCSSMANKQDQININLLQTLSNVAANSLSEAKKLIYHNVFDFVIQCCKEVQKVTIFTLAFYIITTLTTYQDYQITQTLLRKYTILRIFVLGLSTNTPIPSTCVEILHALYKLIAFYGGIYSGAQNRIIYELEMFYNINKVLHELEERTENKKVKQKVNCLLNALHGEYIY